MKAVLLLFVSLMVGCSSEPADDEPDIDLPTLDPALQARVDAAIASIQSDPCVKQGNTKQCQWADYEIGAPQLDMERSTGEAILIIDRLADFVPELLRYRNHIAGYYRISGDRLEPQIESVRLPKRFGDVLLSFAGPDFIPASSLAAVARVALPAYAKLNLPNTAGHGGIVLGHLLDLVPEHPLVLLDTGPLFSIPPEICQLGIDSQRLVAATAHNAAIATSLRQVMTDHNVRFINASFGLTVPVIAEAWRQSCTAPLPSADQLRELLHVYDPIHTAMFNTEGVLAVHAAAQLGSPEDFPFDQVNTQYPNQVRAGFFSSLSSGLDEAGRGAISKAKQFPSNESADVYFNWGCEEDASGTKPLCAAVHYEFVVAFGLNTFTFPFMSTSFISPLALARLARLRYANHASEPMSNVLIQTLKRELTPPLCGPDGAQPCVYQDPILHGQLEMRGSAL